MADFVLEKQTSLDVLTCFNSYRAKHFTFDIIMASAIVASAVGVKIILDSNNTDFAKYLGLNVYDDYFLAKNNIDKNDIVYFKNLSTNTGQTIISISDYNFFSFEKENDAIDVMNMLKKQNVISAICVVSKEPLIEGVSACCDTKIFELKNGFVHEYEITPEKFGIKKDEISSLIGATCQYNYALINDIFWGRIKGAKLDSIVMNAGIMIYTIGSTPNILQGIIKAYNAVDKGFALSKLKSLKNNY